MIYLKIHQISYEIVDTDWKKQLYVYFEPNDDEYMQLCVWDGIEDIVLSEYEMFDKKDTYIKHIFIKATFNKINFN